MGLPGGPSLLPTRQRPWQVPRTSCAPGDRLTKLLISTGVAATLAGAIMIVAVHLQPDHGGVNPVRGMLSDYALRPLGWVFHLALVIVSVGSVALWLALTRNDVLRGWFGALGMGLWCVSLVCVALFTKDPSADAPTVVGGLHLAFTAVACGSMPVVCLVLGWQHRRHPLWRGYARSALALALANVPCVLPFLLPFVLDQLNGSEVYIGPATGLVERVMVALDLCALLVLGIWAWRAPRRAGAG